jgi:predicted nucleic acid-binding protein
LTGTIGVIIVAREQNPVAAVRPPLEPLRLQGYWLSDALINLATKLADE